MSTYDGTQKANSGCAQNIPYHIFRTSYVDNLRQDALAMASSEAIAFCDVDNFSGPEIECDASTLTEDEWQKRRAHTIGGSDCAAIFGENRYKTNLDVYYEKIGQQPVFAQEETPESRLNKLWGHIAEEYIKQWIAERYPYCEIFYDTNIYRYPEKPYITANIDGMMRKPDGSYCLLEFKTANSMKKGEWENGNVPPQYIYQVRQYMAILGVWECIVVCIFDRDNVVANTVVRDLDEEMRIIDGLDEFWNDHVLPRIPPEPLGTADGIISTLQRYGGPANPRADRVRLTGDELEELCRQCVEMSLEKARAKKMADEVDARCKELSIGLIAALGNATDGALTSADGTTEYQIRYRPRKAPKKVDFDMLQARYPDAFAACVSQEAEGSRTFGIKAIARN